MRSAERLCGVRRAGGSCAALRCPEHGAAPRAATGPRSRGTAGSEQRFQTVQTTAAQCQCACIKVSSGESGAPVCWDSSFNR